MVKVDMVVALREGGYLLDREDEFALSLAVESGSIELVTEVVAAMWDVVLEEVEEEVDDVIMSEWFGRMIAKGITQAVRLGDLRLVEKIYAEFVPRFDDGEDLMLLPIKEACRFPHSAPLEWCVKRFLFDAGEMSVER